MTKRLSKLYLACAAALATLAAPAGAAVYELGDNGSGLFGIAEYVTTSYEDTLLDLGRLHSLGYEEIRRVNPGVDPWLPGEGTQVLLPGQRVLPPGPREGIVVNLPEHRLYYFPKPKKGEQPVVVTYPVSIGKMDWKTPLGRTSVVGKEKNPNWYPPASIRKEHAARGDPLPRVVPPGPDNPLGAYKMRLGIDGGSYLIHGTNNPAAVGMAITHGCIRMYPEDIERMFPTVPVGTPVYLVNEPIKIAFVDGMVYLEVHPPVDAEGQSYEPNIAEFSAMLDKALGDSKTAIYGEIALEALEAANGMPVLIGIEADPELPPGAELPEQLEAGIAPTSGAEPQLEAGAAPPVAESPADAEPQLELPAAADPTVRPSVYSMPLD